jgi:hypothetical protein
MGLRDPLTLFPLPWSRHTTGVPLGNLALGKAPHPSWLRCHLPFDLSTVQWSGQLETDRAEPFPKHGAHGWAVQPQEARQTEGRGRLRLGQDVTSQVSLPSARQQAAHPHGAQLASPACAIAVEEGLPGATEQLELGFLGLDPVLTVVQVEEAAAGPVGTWG